MSDKIIVSSEICLPPAPTNRPGGFEPGSPALELLAGMAFVAPAIVSRSQERPGLTLCAYASCHSAASPTRLSSFASPSAR